MIARIRSGGGKEQQLSELQSAVRPETRVRVRVRVRHQGHLRRRSTVENLRVGLAVAFAVGAGVPASTRRNRHASAAQLALAEALLLHAARAEVMHAVLIHQDELMGGRRDPELFKPRRVAVRREDLERPPAASTGHSRQIAIAAKSALRHPLPGHDRLTSGVAVWPAEKAPRIASDKDAAANRRMKPAAICQGER